jgi:hypothetical protein
MNFYYWHLTAEIWHLAAFTLLTCFVLPFTLPGCCCNGFLVMKSVREGKDSYWYIQVLDKGKGKFEKGLQNKTTQSQSFVPSFEITFMKKMFTCRYEVKPPVFGMRTSHFPAPSFWHENEPLSSRYYSNSKAVCYAAEEATLYTFLHGSSRCKR